MLRKLEIANMAIGHTGEGQTISNLEESSREARVCRQFIDVARNVLLRGFDWNFARRPDVSLALVGKELHPDWNFGYAYPRDCLQLRAVGDDRPYNRMLWRDGQQIILSNEEKATASYTSSDLRDNYFDDFGLAWSYDLAILIAPSVTEGNIRTLLTSLEMQRKMAMDKAIENDANEESPPSEQSPAINAGGFIGIYP